MSAFFASESATVATTLPNFVLATPSYTTPAYAFNTSVTAKLGEVVSSELATSTYKPAFNGLKASALPLVSVTPGGQTFIVTQSGETLTQTSNVPSSTLPLGVPYDGWSSTGRRTSSIPFALSIILIFPVFILSM